MYSKQSLLAFAPGRKTKRESKLSLITLLMILKVSSKVKSQKGSLDSSVFKTSILIYLNLDQSKHT